MPRKEPPRVRAAREKREKEERDKKERAAGEHTAPIAPEPPEEEPVDHEEPVEPPEEGEIEEPVAGPEPETAVMEREPSTLGRVLAAAAIVAVGLVVAVVVAAAAFDDDGSTEAKTVTETEAAAQASRLVATEVPGGDQPSGTQIERSAAAEYLLGQGYKLGQFSFTVDKPVYTERGAASVSEKPIFTEQELKEWIQGDSDRAKAYLKYAKDNLSDVDYDRIRQGEGFVRVQLLVPSEYTKNSFFTEGRVVGTTERRSVEAGDIVFLYVSAPVMKKLANGREEETSDVHPMGNTRGPCGNGGVEPVPTTGPPAPSITVPPGGGETPGPGPEPEPVVETPEGGGGSPGTHTTPEHHEEPPPKEQPKTDTPSNDGGPNGKGGYQPPSDTQPPAGQSPSSNHPPAEGTPSPHPASPEGTAPPPGGKAPEATNGGETTGGPAADY